MNVDRPVRDGLGIWQGGASKGKRRAPLAYWSRRMTPRVTQIEPSPFPPPPWTTPPPSPDHCSTTNFHISQLFTRYTDYTAAPSPILVLMPYIRPIFLVKYRIHLLQILVRNVVYVKNAMHITLVVVGALWYLMGRSQFRLPINRILIYSKLTQLPEPSDN